VPVAKAKRRRAVGNLPEATPPSVARALVCGALHEQSSVSVEADIDRLEQKIEHGQAARMRVVHGEVARPADESRQ
jgi:hypothetical protein